ncbi:MAG: hypothetical protein RJA59_493, partial [Pseudomonadota bacterium]
MRSPVRGESAASASRGRSGREFTMTSGRSLRMASTTASATSWGVHDPSALGGAWPNLANIPSSVTRP